MANKGTFKKGDKRAGRPVGSKNKSTTDVREAIARIAQNKAEEVEEWLDEIKDPAKRVALYLDMCEYHIPKLARTEVVGKDGKEIVIQIVKYADHPAK